MKEKDILTKFRIRDKAKIEEIVKELDAFADLPKDTEKERAYLDIVGEDNYGELFDRYNKGEALGDLRRKLEDYKNRIINVLSEDNKESKQMEKPKLRPEDWEANTEAESIAEQRAQAGLEFMEKGAKRTMEGRLNITQKQWETAHEEMEKKIGKKKEEVAKAAYEGVEKGEKAGGTIMEIKETKIAGKELEIKVESAAQKAEVAIEAEKPAEEIKEKTAVEKFMGKLEEKGGMNISEFYKKESEKKVEKVVKKEDNGNKVETVKKSAEAAKETEKAREAKEEKERKPKTAEELLRYMADSRRSLVVAEKAWRDAKEKNEEGRAVKEGRFEEEKFKHEKAVAEYARMMMVKKIELLKRNGIDESNPRYEIELNRFKGELFNDVIIKQQDELAKERYENLEPRKRTWFRTMMENYAKAPRWKKVMASAGMAFGIGAGGAALGTGIGIGAALVFGATKGVRSAIGGTLGGWTFGAIKAIGGKRAEELRQRELQAIEGSFGMRIEQAKSEDDVRDMVINLWTQYENVVKETNKQHRNITRFATAGSILVGGLSAYGAGATGFDKAILDKMGIHLTEAPIAVGAIMETTTGEGGGAKVFNKDQFVAKASAQYAEAHTIKVSEGVSAGVGEVPQEAPSVDVENILTPETINSIEGKIGGILSHLNEYDRKGLYSAVNQMGGWDKFVEMNASELFYQGEAGAPIDIYLQKFGMELQRLTYDAPALRGTATIKDILESINAKEIFGK